jgi:hypothetical protein
MMTALRAELVISQRVLAGEKPEILRFDQRVPVPGLGADRTITLSGAGLEIDVRLVTHGSAVAAALVGLFHDRGS